jgi:transcriptional activator for dhaKLM operon
MFDMSGRLLGVLGMVMPVERYHIHSLGLVAAATRAIENQRQSDALFAEQNSQLSQLNTILSAISDGILVFGSNNILVHVNNAASQMLGVPSKSMMGKHPETLFSVPAFLSKAVLQKTPLVDVEGLITIEGREVNCLISLDFVFKTPGEIQWIIVTLRSQKKVRKLVQRQVGANATLTLDDIPGESPQLSRVRSFVNSAAGAQASILIRGEVGTGKNALASAIHNAAHRREGPFVVFSCSSIPNELVVSELLGYEEGEEGKHLSGRPSKFELAEGGTLFFQNVDVLPLEAQSVLLNALELGVIQRLGSRRAVEINTRVIASTSANIEALIAQGSFRPDLYYRLSTFTVTLPPLRERPRDIPLVVNRILTRFEKQLGYQVSIAPEVMDLFKKYPWPGNIREVEAVLGRAATHATNTDIIGLMDIPANVRRMETTSQSQKLLLQVGSLDEVEGQTIRVTAQTQRGNVSRMAQALGVSRTTLWRKLKLHGINPEEYRH